MSAASAKPATRRRELNAVEMIVIVTVVAAFVLFEVWVLLPRVDEHLNRCEREGVVGVR